MNFRGLTVGQFIDALKKMPQSEAIKFDFVHFGPSTLESYRGYYEDVALGYEECGYTRRLVPYSYPTVEELRYHFEAMLGKVFCGWKGGNGTPVSLKTSLWVANPGETGDTVIIGVQQLLYVTIITRQEDEA